MTPNKTVRILSVLVFFAGLSLPARSAGLLFDKGEYAARRLKLMEKIPDGAAVLFGVPSGTEYGLFQTNDFIYFTGVEVPGAVLIMDGTRKTSALFFTMTEKTAKGEGIDPAIVRQPKETTGIEDVYPYEAFSPYLQRLSGRVPVLYTSFLSEEVGRETAAGKFQEIFRNMTTNEWDGRLTRELQFVKLLCERFPQAAVKDSTELIRDLRKIKSSAEVEMMRRAGRIGAKAHIELMKSCRPGLYEYELSSLFEHVCKANGAMGLAFETIISSAENHAFIHYCRHDRLLKDGDFLVVDAGPDLGYYDADISVSFPANGKFTPRQREIYEACNEVSKACLGLYRPGVTAYEVGGKVREILKAKGYDLSKDVFAKLRFFKEGGLTHSVGLAVHDAAGRDFAPDEPFRAGMVFASDVFAVYEAENLGVRVENTVLITGSGCENLTPGIPREIPEIEALMRKKGLVQILKENGIDLPGL
ncbi:M24 family metallopeptidase [bacterium]|nr:MAG: M24 family metallopeptidase [bacterium]